MQTFTHPPFAMDTCDICHQPAKDGKVVLTQADSKALCVTCHSEQAEKIEKAKVQHPGAQGDCIACHNPHAGKTPGFIQPDPVNACLACHSEQADQKKAHLHQPAFGLGLRHLPRAARQRQRAPAAGQRQRAVPGMPWTRLAAAEAGNRARGDDLQRQGQIAGGLLREESVVILPIKYGLGIRCLAIPFRT